MTDTYTCARCGGVFEKGWSDEEALAETKTKFPETPLEEKVIICHDCFMELFPEQ